MLTCKDFLAELSDYLDETVAAEIRGKLEEHLKLCPNCWVICDTTRKTIQVYKGQHSCQLPEDIHSRLMQAIDRKMAAKKSGTSAD